MERKIIINADDFGLCDGVNRAVVQAHTQGILTSTTIMANMPAAPQAIELARQLPTLGVGVHLNLSEGKPYLKTQASIAYWTRTASSLIRLSYYLFYP